jgi:hypothetical protein
MKPPCCPTCERPWGSIAHRRLPNLDDPIEPLTSPDETRRFLCAKSNEQKPLDRNAADHQLDLPLNEERRDGSS